MARTLVNNNDLPVASDAFFTGGRAHVQHHLSSPLAVSRFNTVLENVDTRKPMHWCCPLADYGHQARLRLRGCTLSESQMPLREIPCYTYKLSNEAFTAMVMHKLDIAPLAFASRPSRGQHVRRLGLKCSCSRRLRIDHHPWHHLHCRTTNKKRHNVLRDQIAEQCRRFGKWTVKELNGLSELDPRVQFDLANLRSRPTC